eukprot:scaffold55710_cov25-Tisochrysis_lutea.AAC.7
MVLTHCLESFWRRTTGPRADRAGDGCGSECTRAAAASPRVGAWPLACAREVSAKRRTGWTVPHDSWHWMGGERSCVGRRRGCMGHERCNSKAVAGEMWKAPHKQ